MGPLPTLSLLLRPLPPLLLRLLPPLLVWAAGFAQPDTATACPPTLLLSTLPAVFPLPLPQTRVLSSPRPSHAAQAVGTSLSPSSSPSLSVSCRSFLFFPLP